jgi:hypothetical protein
MANARPADWLLPPAARSCLLGCSQNSVKCKKQIKNLIIAALVSYKYFALFACYYCCLAGVICSSYY